MSLDYLKHNDIETCMIACKWTCALHTLEVVYPDINFEITLSADIDVPPISEQPIWPLLHTELEGVAIEDAIMCFNGVFPFFAITSWSCKKAEPLLKADVPKTAMQVLEESKGFITDGTVTPYAKYDPKYLKVVEDMIGLCKTTPSVDMMDSLSYMINSLKSGSK